MNKPKELMWHKADIHDLIHYHDAGVVGLCRFTLISGVRTVIQGAQLQETACCFMLFSVLARAS